MSKLARRVSRAARVARGCRSRLIGRRGTRGHRCSECRSEHHPAGLPRRVSHEPRSTLPSRSRLMFASAFSGACRTRRRRSACDPAEMALAPGLVAEREHDAACGRSVIARPSSTVWRSACPEDVLARLGAARGRLEVHVVRVVLMIASIDGRQDRVVARAARHEYLPRTSRASPPNGCRRDDLELAERTIASRASPTPAMPSRRLSAVRSSRRPYFASIFQRRDRLTRACDAGVGLQSPRSRRSRHARRRR